MHTIDTIDSTSQATISTLQTHTWKVSSNLGRSQTPNKTSDTHKDTNSKGKI